MGNQKQNKVRTQVDRREKRLTAIDLFSGCGGLTQGLKRAGFDVLGAVECNALCVDTYRSNHSGVLVWKKDIRQLPVSDVKRRLALRKGQLDLLAGCPPCQGFSTLRTLNGAKRNRDKGKDLLWEFLRFVEDLRPKAIMLENVPGLLDDHRFKEFRRRMAELGYEDRCEILNAADYGVPQRRRRLIYLAGLNFCIPFGNESKRKKTVKDAIGALPRPGRTGDHLHDFEENRTPKVAALIRRIPANGGSRLDLREESQLLCHQRCDGFKDVYGRMSWQEEAPTITSGCFNPSKGRFLHPSQHRTITMREAALLQGFPRAYKFPETVQKVAAALMIGNALPPAFIASHARSVRRAIATSRAK